MLDHIMYWSSNMLSWIPIYLIMIILFVRHFRTKQYPYIVTNILLVISLIFIDFLICTQLLPAIIEYFVIRVRPCYDPAIADHLHLAGEICEARFGFFASRACATVAISAFLFLAFRDATKWIKYYLVFWALLVSYSRIYLGMHYPLNVVVADIFGLITGYLTYKSYFYVTRSVLVI